MNEHLASEGTSLPLEDLSTIDLKYLQSLPCLMNPIQRLVLLSFFLGTAPSNYVEVGVARGGSALIWRYAMNILGQAASAVLIDPRIERVDEEVRSQLGSSVLFLGRKLDGNSVVQAFAEVGPFNCVLIDALHSLERCRFDIFTVYPFVEPGGHIIMDDANYFEVREAVSQAVSDLPLEDCGRISTHGRVDGNALRPPNDRWKDEPIVWGGLHLLRKSSRGIDPAGPMGPSWNRDWVAPNRMY